MQHFIPHAYKIECLSNLHVGSGDNNYGVIDKQVQRDSISNIPVIHASGLKGALREYFEVMTDLDKEKINTIFGSSKKATDNMQQGAFRFMEARLLSLPLRGIQDTSYYAGTSLHLLQEFNRLAAGVGAGYQIAIPQPSTLQAETEFGQAPLIDAIKEIGEQVVLMSKEMQTDALSHLPVIARNSLDNGQSENLWYEEVVPRESIFYFFVLVPQNTESGFDFENDFNKHLHNKFVQIGANATVGYGCCNISKLF